ncbi:DUF1919 domain-containing protein [Persicobacter diffluens]|uniref:DUF1919 domain-containing protein n=1 Tax=Persicobacter diffluens TaxID=981 RepID=A0AAN4VVV2_9BACT|nr:hypothetical protein PEDI_03120 [Persicobacter diffluens]
MIQILFNSLLLPRKLKKWLYKKYATQSLKGRPFTLLSSNCLGGQTCKEAGIPYNSPTVGLFLYPEDFYELCRAPEYFFHAPLTFIKESKYPSAKKHLEEHHYPIGCLKGEIEIHFLHYKNEEEARTKWNRRVRRINWKNILVITNDQNEFTPEMLSHFDQIKYPKILLSAKELNHPDTVPLSYFKKEAHVGDTFSNRLKIIKDFDLVQWIVKNTP